jgi:hypothetical protein
MAERNSQDTQMSISERYAQHCLDALVQLRGTWMGDPNRPDPADITRATCLESEKFDYQIAYLIHMLPSKKKRDELLKTWIDLMQDDHQESSKEIHMRGMQVVSEVYLFIVQNFDLVHVDGMGPATIKDYIKSEIELPDMQDDSDALPDDGTVPDPGAVPAGE